MNTPWANFVRCCEQFSFPSLITRPSYYIWKYLFLRIIFQFSLKKGKIQRNVCSSGRSNCCNFKQTSPSTININTWQKRIIRSGCTFMLTQSFQTEEPLNKNNALCKHVFKVIEKKIIKIRSCSMTRNAIQTYLDSLDEGTSPGLIKHLNWQSKGNRILEMKR